MTTTVDKFSQIVNKYGFFTPFKNEEELKEEIFDISWLIYSSDVKNYQDTINKIYVFEELIDKMIPFLKDDLDGCYLSGLVDCAKEVFNVSTVKEVLLLCAKYFKRYLDENNIIIIEDISDAISMLEEQEEYLVLPEVWLSPNCYKKICQFLKTFSFEPTKIKNRKAFKNCGEFSITQVKDVGIKLNGVSLSEVFDFYPTPVELVELVQDLAEVRSTDTILEPSAGTGNLITGYNTNNITCVELSPILAEVLINKGYNVNNMSFEDYAINNSVKFDRIIMNPPFGKRLDAKHIDLAFNMLKNDGILIAISSTGIKNATDKASKKYQDLYEKYGVFQEIYKGMFKNSGKGTSIDVMVTKLIKKVD